MIAILLVTLVMLIPSLSQALDCAAMLDRVIQNSISEKAPEYRARKKFNFHEFLQPKWREDPVIIAKMNRLSNKDVEDLASFLLWTSNKDFSLNTEYSLEAQIALFLIQEFGRKRTDLNSFVTLFERRLLDSIPIPNITASIIYLQVMARAVQEGPTSFDEFLTYVEIAHREDYLSVPSSAVWALIFSSLEQDDYTISRQDILIRIFQLQIERSQKVEPQNVLTFVDPYLAVEIGIPFFEAHGTPEQIEWIRTQRTNLINILRLDYFPAYHLDNLFRRSRILAMRYRRPD